MGTTVSRDTTPPPDVVGSDVNAIFQGMTDDVIARQQARRAAGLPPQLSPTYRPPVPAALQPTPPAAPPAPGAQQASLLLQPQQSPAPWAQPPGLQPSQVAVGTPQVQLTPQVVQPQPPEQLPARVGEKPPINNMPPVWNGDQKGPSGQTKQQFLVGRMMHESQGDPLALNYVARNDPRMYAAGYTAQGLLQDVNSTWANGVRWAAADPQRYPMSSDPRQYKTAREAPWDVQWQVNSAIYDHAGEQPWREQGGGFKAYASGVRGEYQSPDQRTPHQEYLPAEPRSFHQWGQEPTGAPARPQDAGGIFSKFAPLLLGIASLALRLPLSSAVTAYSAMSRAQYNGQQEAWERERTKYQDLWKEASAKQNLESQDYGDAFATFGENNPQGLQQTLAQLALKYNDPQMLRLAEQGDLNGAHRLQAQRDMLNQNLAKGSKAIEEQRDREAQDAAVAAMDRKYQQEHPEATADDLAIAHNEHLRQATSAKGAADKPEQEGEVKNVLGPDGKRTGQQVREGKQGGYFDPNTKEPVQLKPGETVETSKSGAGDTLEAAKPYDVVDKDGKVQRTVLARERKDQAGFLDAQTGEPIKLAEGEKLQPHTRSTAADSLEVSKPYDIVDDKGHIVKPNVMLREARNKAGYVHSETGESLKLEPGQSVKQITPTTSGGGRAGAQVLRQLVGGREVLSDLQNVVRLPVGTTIGPLGTAVPGPTIVGALTGDLSRTLTDQDSQLMQASMASMERELSILMSPVYGGNWAAQQIAPLIPKTGDTIQTVMFKLARLAQSADNALEASATSPILSNEEQQYANDLRRQISEAIPWSSAEAMDFAYRGQPRETFGDYARREGIKGGGGAQMPDWAKQSATGPDGKKIYSPDGNSWFHQDHTPVQ